MEKFLVGGAVRDELLGKRPKDFDYTVVLERWDKIPIAETSAFDIMVEQLEKEGFKIFLKTPEHFTVRAQFPKSSGQRLTADFVMARREGPYSDGRRPDWVVPGQLEDDLARRDFTMNAIAKGEDNLFHDPFGGMFDIQRRMIRAVGDPKERMMEDALRVMRALRFKVQLGFIIHPDTDAMLFDRDVLNALRNVSDERKMDELNKMFKANARDSINQLWTYGELADIVFAGKVNLEATMKQKGFNK